MEANSDRILLSKYCEPFHQGHLRSTIIRGFLTNLYKSAGWDIARLNYLGDWGKQYCLLALGFELFGDKKALKLNPINHLYEIYVKVNKEFAAEGDDIKRLKDAGDDASELKTEGLDGTLKQCAIITPRRSRCGRNSES
jgi:arginyl-tRNA synthetase